MSSSQLSTHLPTNIITLASNMWGGTDNGKSIGFSGPQIIDFFSGYSSPFSADDYHKIGGTRADIFKTCITSCPFAEQKLALMDLCNYLGPMKYHSPSKEACEQLRDKLAKLDTGPMYAMNSTIRSLNWHTVHSDWEKAQARANSDPDGAITMARTLLETVCKHILEDAQIEYKDDGQLNDLYRLTAKQLSLSPSQHEEQVFKQILGGCFSVANGLGSIRNKLGDAHGKGAKHKKAKPRHAKLAVNLGCSLAEFLLETYSERKEK